MKKEIKLEQCIGKTISNTAFSWQGEMIVAFEDDTYIIFKAEEGYEGEVNITTTSLDLDNWSDSDLLTSSIFTKEELEKVKKEAAIEFNLAREKADLATYARLKKKFKVLIK